MAVARFPGSLFAQFVWPLFGAASVVGIALSIMLRHFHRLTAGWLLCCGCRVSVCWRAAVPGIAGLLLGGLLVGGGFLCAVQLSFIWPGTGASAYALYGRAAHHRLCGRATCWPVTSALSTWLHQLEPALGLAGIALFIGGALVWNRQAESKQQLQ
jgi:hypothetical protein